MTEATAKRERKLRAVEGEATASEPGKRVRKARTPTDHTSQLKSITENCRKHHDSLRRRESQLESQLLGVRAERETVEAQLRRLESALGDVPELPNVEATTTNDTAQGAPVEGATNA